jgi:hypothetical protein
MFVPISVKALTVETEIFGAACAVGVEPDFGLNS